MHRAKSASCADRLAGSMAIARNIHCMTAICDGRTRGKKGSCQLGPTQSPNLLGQFLSKLLFGVTPFDVPTLVMVATVLGVATVTASWLPARRAMRLDPVAVIRQD